MFGLGPTELIIIGVIVLLIFGAKRFPEIGKGIGGAVREFKNIKKDIGSDASKDKGGNDEKKDGGGGSPPSLESRAVGKIVDHVPGARRVKGIKEKADKIKDIVK